MHHRQRRLVIALPEETMSELRQRALKSGNSLAEAAREAIDYGLETINQMEARGEAACLKSGNTS
jgi:plasmid stability protein